MSRTPSDLTIRKNSPSLPHRIFRAGAGAGKTTTLVREVIRLSLEFQEKNGRAPRVIVTTFTRKATQELKERLLEEGIRADNEALLHFVTSPSLLMISTLHGVLAQFLTQMSGSLGIDAEFRLVDEMQADRKWKVALRKLFIVQSDFAELLERYSFAQLARFARSYVLRAVSGSTPGALTEAMIWNDVHELLRSFGAEVAQVQRALKASPLSGAWIEITGILERFATDVMKATSPEAWTSVRAEWPDVVENLSLPRGKARKEVDDSTIDAIKAIKDQIEVFSDLEFDPLSWKQMIQDAAILDRLGHTLAIAWKKEKLESGELSIEDLEILSLCVLKEFPEVGAQFADQWDYWFIDEYQDTSPSQVQLLEHLIGTAGHFVVGDPQQSIYFFRGARSEVFFKKEADFRARGVEVEFLKTNRRSHPSLLLFFNDFFRSVSVDQFQEMEPNPAIAIPDGHRQVARFFLVPDRPQELDAVVWQLQQWRESGIAFKDMAVLTRTHKDLEDVAARILAAGFPSQIISSGGFYDRQEVLDALCLLRFLVSPHDDVNTLSLVRSPWLHLTDAFITQHLAAKSERSVWTQLTSAVDSKDLVLEKMRNYIQRAQLEGASEVFREALEELGLFAFCHAQDSTGLREANLWKLVQKLKQDEHRAGFSFIQFIANARAGLEEGLEQNDGDAVSAFEPNRVMLMTVHASKGLGIPYVILPFIQKDLRPSRRETFLYDELENRWLTASPTPDGKRLDVSAIDA